MRKGWIALIVCGGVALGFSLASTGQSQAAMVIASPAKSMSLIQEAKKKRSARYSCWTFFCQRCCTDRNTGKETCRPICM
jgi:hypothetical protein